MATDAQKQELRDKVTGLVADRFGGDFTKAFDHYDANRDGRISRDELGALLSDAGIGSWVTRGAWATGIIDALDSDKDGSISAAELQAAL